MPSFDVVSEVDLHEVRNATDQANKEVTTRFDFKGSDASFELKDDAISLKAENTFQLKQMMDILRNKFTKRNIDASALDPQKTVETGINNATQKVLLKQGLDSDNGKKVVKALKAGKLKVQSQIQGEVVFSFSMHIAGWSQCLNDPGSHCAGIPTALMFMLAPCSSSSQSLRVPLASALIRQLRSL